MPQQQQQSSPHTLAPTRRLAGPAGRLAQRQASEQALMELAQLLKDELPVRLAHRIQDLDGIPQLSDMPSVQTVKGIYIHSLLSLLEISPPNTPTRERDFGILLQELYQNHSHVLLQMAKGAWEFKSKLKGQSRRGAALGNAKNDKTELNSVITFAQQEECHAFLNRFYASRVGIRVLAGQYLAVRQQWLQQQMHPCSLRIRTADPMSVPAPSPAHGYIGMICQDTSPYELVQSAIDDATRLCVAQFGEAPRVVVHGRLDLTFPYIPTHLHYILLELLKNALRATVEHYYYKEQQQQDVSHSERCDEFENEERSSSPLLKYSLAHTRESAVSPTPFPDVVVIIADNKENEDVTIKISDQGGGIPRSQMEHIWSYLYTTANPRIHEGFLNKATGGGNSNSDDTEENHLVLAGLGYGLPMSRAYARYFGGDLDIISMEGYGTDVSFCSFIANHFIK